jgi:hypothetical protein
MTTMTSRIEPRKLSRIQLRDQHLHRAGAADQVDDPIDEERDDADVDGVAKAEVGE